MASSTPSYPQPAILARLSRKSPLNATASNRVGCTDRTTLSLNAAMDANSTQQPANAGRIHSRDAATAGSGFEHVSHAELSRHIPCVARTCEFGCERRKVDAALAGRQVSIGRPSLSSRSTWPRQRPELLHALGQVFPVDVQVAGIEQDAQAWVADLVEHAQAIVQREDLVRFKAMRRLKVQPQAACPAYTPGSRRCCGADTPSPWPAVRQRAKSRRRRAPTARRAAVRCRHCP